MDLKIDCHKVGCKILHSISFHPTDFVSVSKKDLANISLKLSGAQEVSPKKLPIAENKLSENSACVYIIQKKLSHSVW